ncbi:MAG: hypothetical protein HQ523_08020 [Lentisphaerae bacterium]|nr:hypothetical protein [Lentisphaerota bacterium]
MEARDPHMLVAECKVTRPVFASTQYQPVMLDSRLNGVALGTQAGVPLAADALPPGGSAIDVEGVPFLLPHRDQGDHIDVGNSLFHYRNDTQRIDMRDLWLPPTTLDANRILLSVPNHPYRRLWLLAASDDGPDSVPLITVRFYRQSAGAYGPRPLGPHPSPGSSQHTLPRLGLRHSR